MPDEWDQPIAVLRENLVVLPQLLRGVAPDRLPRAPTPGEWSAHVIGCHLVLNEMNTAVSLLFAEVLTRMGHLACSGKSEFPR